MSHDKSLTQVLKSALQGSGIRLNEPGLAQTIKGFEQLQHSLAVRNPKEAKRQLEKFTRRLVELLTD
jgi:hypothetical protein